MLKHPLARDVVIVVAVKTVIVIAAALFVFGPAARPHLDSETVAAQIVSDVAPHQSPWSASHD